MKSKSLLRIRWTALLMLGASIVQAATFTYNNATAWQNWNVPGNWTVVGVDGDGIPDADDDVTIPAGFQVTANLTSSMNSLTINGDIRFRNPVTPTLTIGTLDMNSGTLGHNSGNRVGIVNVTNDMRLLSGSCTIGECALTVAGTLRVYGTYNESSNQGTITFNAVQMYFGSNWFYNNNETFNVTNNFTMKGATVDGTGTGRFIIGGNLIIDSTDNNWGRSRLTENGKIIINSGASFIITDLPGSKTVNDIEVNTGGTWDDIVGESWSIGGDILNDGTVNMTAGTWTLTGTGKTISGTSLLSVFNTTVTGSYTNDGNYLAVNTLAGGGSWTQGVNSTLDIDRTSNITTLNASASGNTVIYSRDAGQNIKAPADGSYFNLTISGASGTKSLTAATVVTNDLVIGPGVVLDVTNANNYQLNVGGDWNNSGTFNERNGLVVFDGASAQTITNLSTETFFDVQFSNAGIKTLDANISVTDDLDILSPATLDASINNFSITVGDDWTNSGTFIPQQGTVTLSNTGTGSINGAGANDFFNLTSVSPANTLNTSATLAGTLTIPSGNFNTTGQTFTLLSTASGTGRIAAITAPRFTGNITMQRFIPGTTTGWGLLGAPISTTLASWTDDFPTSGFTGSTDPAFNFVSIYAYDETVGGVFDNPSAYIAATNSTNTVSIGSGRWVYLGDGPVTTSDITVDVAGAPHIGNHNFGVTFTSSGGAANDGWNLVSNPYPSAIDWNAASGWTKSNVSGTIYIWNADVNQFATWNGTSGTNGGTRFIASSQGFYIQTTAASPVLSCTESVKSATNPTMLREGQNNGNGDMIRFKLRGQGFSDETLFGFSQDATIGYDVNIDALKLKSPVPTVPSLTQFTDNLNLSVNFVPAVNRNTEIYLKLETPVAGDYSLSFEGIDAFPENECVTLTDLRTGEITDIRKIKQYNFYCQAMDADVRFMVQVSSPLPFSTTGVSCGHINDGSIDIGPSADNHTYSLFNNDGILVSSGIAGNAHIDQLAAGNYTIQFMEQSNGCKDMNSQVVINAAPEVEAGFKVKSVEVKDEQMTVVFSNESKNGTGTWYFGDGVVEDSRLSEVVHTYARPGAYPVSLIVKGGHCSDNFAAVVQPETPETSFNPALLSGPVHVIFNGETAGAYFNFNEDTRINLELISVTGKLVFKQEVIVRNNVIDIPLSQMADGTYLLHIYSAAEQFYRGKLVK